MASFEEVSVKFLSINEIDALREFLRLKISHLNETDTIQVSLIATWLIELYLEALIKREECSNKEESKFLTDEFRSFLSSQHVLVEIDANERKTCRLPLSMNCLNRKERWKNT
jgi:hypothetical protein